MNGRVAITAKVSHMQQGYQHVELIKLIWWCTICVEIRYCSCSVFSSIQFPSV